MVALMQRQSTGRKVRGKVANGNGGGGTGSWNGYGDDPGFGREHQRIKSLRGPNTSILEDFAKDTGVDPFNPGLINAQQAGKASAYVETKLPKWIEYHKTYYAGAKKASDADLKTKEIQTDWAIHHAGNLVKQQEQDHLLEREQNENSGKLKTMRWETREAQLMNEGSLSQLANYTV